MAASTVNFHNEIKKEPPEEFKDTYASHFKDKEKAIEIKVEEEIKQEIDVEYHELKIEENLALSHKAELMPLKLDREKMWKSAVSKKLKPISEHPNKKHIINVAPITGYHCEKCDYKTTLKTLLMIHNISTHKMIKCDKCAFSFKDRKSLKWHMAHRHQKGIKWFHCDRCEFKTIRHKNNVHQHMINKHLNKDEIQWFKCKKCDFATEMKRNMKSHMISTHFKDNEIKWFKCEECEYKTKYSGHMRPHMLNKHGNADFKRFRCEKCDYKCKSKRDLQEHMTKKHLNEEVEWFRCYNCHHCDYSTINKSHLTCHEKEHLNEKIIG